MIREAISSVVAGQSLAMGDAATVMREIMEGDVTPGQLGALLAALCIKGETAEEIAGFATGGKTLDLAFYRGNALT